jgi:hypothetical protein
MSVLDAWNRWRAARKQHKAAQRARAFWGWFAGISDALQEFIRGDLESDRSESRSPTLAEWVAELNRRTAAYHPAVRAVIGQSADTLELVLTSEGNPAGAEHVRSLVASHPSLPSWTIRAFKPAVPHSVVQVGTVTLTPDDVEFAVIDITHPDIGEATLLLLFVPGLAGTHSAEVTIAARKLIEGVVGEESFLRWDGRVVMEDRERPAEKVATIERRPLHQVAAILREFDRDFDVVSSE